MLVDATTLPQALYTLILTQTEALAAHLGWSRRRSKLSATHFVLLCVRGFWQTPTATLDTLSGLSGAMGVSITPEGLCQRFNAPAEALFAALLAAALAQSQAPRQPEGWAGLRQHFTALYVLDSTTVSLPPALVGDFPGSGGSAPKAALKLQTMLDILSGTITLLEITSGRLPDQRYTGYLETLRAGALYVVDRGYWVLKHFRRIIDGGAYVLTRYHVSTKVLDPATGQVVDLAARLTAATTAVLDDACLLGMHDQVPVRLIAIKAPQRISDQRRRAATKKAKKKAKRKGHAVKTVRTPKPETLVLQGWWLYVTNVPAALLPAAAVRDLYRVRWQIELVFKACKSEFGLARVRGRKRARTMCELYVKVLGLVFAQALVAACGDATHEVSRGKVVTRLQQWAPEVWRPDQRAVQAVWARLAVEIRAHALVERRTRPTTVQRLQAVEALLAPAVPVCAVPFLRMVAPCAA